MKKVRLTVPGFLFPDTLLVKGGFQQHISAQALPFTCTDNIAKNPRRSLSEPCEIM